MSRAAVIDNKHDAELELRRALGSGDTQMAQAIRRLAHERGGAEVATIGVDRELLSELSRLEDLTSLRGRQNIKQRMFRWHLSERPSPPKTPRTLGFGLFRASRVRPTA
jgi:hypothetical protein